jgi:hypothetical protein
MTRSGEDGFHYAVDVAKHVIVPEAQNEIAVSFQICRPFSVFGAAIGVLSAIELNDQASGLATEIDDVGFNWHLSSKLQSL